ncbi:MAG: MarR family transcriptional regulator, partial [Cellulomonas sp.]|nr:MarR family transcriptional regulator [Cellulomonas sp.]
MTDDTDTTSPARPDGDSLAAAVFHLARLLSRRERHGQRGGFAVHRGRGRLLALLALRDQMTQKELAYLLGMRSQSLGEQLAQLQRDGLVLRTTDESDRRTWQVALTDAGREAAPQATESGADDPFAVLSADER